MGFDAAYRRPDAPPWDIGAPQPEIVRLADAGGIDGTVIDVGCGTGENALFLASRGFEVVGVDAAPTAIERARAKAVDRGLRAEFVVGDALDLGSLRRTFDTAIDVGCFHVFDDPDRPRYATSVRTAMRPSGRLLLMCFSDAQPGTIGPRRVSERELRETFRVGWRIEKLVATTFATRMPFLFGGSDPLAWLATIRRT